MGGYNEAELLLLGNWGPLGIALLGALGLLALGVTALDAATLSAGRRAVVLALRATALALALGLLLEPAVELRRVDRSPNRVAVLVDTSESATLPVDGSTRWERTQGALDELADAAAAWADRHEVDVYAVDDDLREESLDTLRDGATRPLGAGTDLGAALEAIADRYGPGELGGVIIVSDGTDLGALGRASVDGEPLPPDAAAGIASLGAPVHTLATAAADSVRDVAIARVRHDEFAFVRNVTRVDVDLTVLGYESGALDLVLRRAGEVLQSRSVPVRAGEARYTVSFEFVPQLLGKEVYSVEVAQRDGEALASNNDEFFVIRVVRDRIRVLQVVGAPSWDVRFLRQLLSGDPNIDLISFFILRGNEDVNRAPNSEMSLIPFPTDELFGSELPSFDLVILQNFDWEPYSMSQYLDEIRDYVRTGGGLVMLGGHRSFASAGYGLTEVAEVLPVELPRVRPGRGELDETPFRPRLTAAGQRHPVTRLAFDAEENAAIWAGLPDLRGTNVVLGPTEGATVLLEHPRLRAPQGPMPVLAVAERGEGRAMALTVDDAWRWSFDAVAGGGTSRAFTTFWNGAIRWLIRDPELNLVQVDVPEPVYRPGDEVVAAVRVFGTDYAPRAAASGRWVLTRRDLDAMRGGDAAAVVVRDEPFVTDDAGRATLRSPIDAEGAWTVEAIVDVGEGEEGRDSEVFLALAVSDELRALQPRPALLEAIAAAGGGVSRPAERARPATLPLVEAPIERIGRRAVIDVWSTPWVLLAFAALLGGEWWLRRRWGLL